MPRRSPLVLAPALALAFAAPSLRAQSAQRWSLQVSPLFVAVSGDIYEGMQGGPGVEAQLRYTPSAFSLGGGVQFSSHGVDAFPDDVYLFGAFVEPRWVIDIGQARFAPYVSARLAALRISLSTSVEDVRVSATGTGVQMNAGGGALVRLGDRVNLDLGATIGSANFGDITVSAAGAGSETIAGGSGRNVVLRVGLAIGLGR